MEQGFGIELLKKCPVGFPSDWKYVDYLRQKDYCCWHHVPDDFFQGDRWLTIGLDLVSTFRNER